MPNIFPFGIKFEYFVDGVSTYSTITNVFFILMYISLLYYFKCELYYF